MGILEEIEAEREVQRAIDEQMGEEFVKLREKFAFDTSLVVGCNIFTHMGKVFYDIDLFDEWID